MQKRKRNSDDDMSSNPSAPPTIGAVKHIVLTLLLLLPHQSLATSIKFSSSSSSHHPINKFNHTNTKYGPSSSSSLRHATSSPRGGSRSSHSPLVEGLKNSLASGVAAAVSKTMLAPFDTIKTVQQQQRSAGKEALKLWDAARLVTSRGNGIFELYAGLGVAVLGAMPSVGLYFGCYSYSKRIIGPFLESHFGKEDDPRRSQLLKTLTIATSAAIGNTIASVSRVPYEVLKQKLQTKQYTSFTHALSSTLSSPATLFPPSSITSQMLRDVPYAIVTLLTYEYLRDAWVATRRNPRPWHDMMAGGFAGGVGSYVTNPMDVIKTRLQTGSQEGVWGCAAATWGEEGVGGFLKGSVPRLIHKVPANALFFVSYEIMRGVLGVSDGGDGGKKREKEER